VVAPGVTDRKARDTRAGGQYCSAMPGLHQVLLFAGAALVLALLPGPSIFYVAARTLAGGRAEGMASSLGTGLGGMVHVLAGAVGV
jgi:threonine/homoserine/homoserine lactone efflux protein